MGIVIIGWVFFRANTLEQAIAFLQAMVGVAQGTSLEYHPGVPARRTDSDVNGGLCSVSTGVSGGAKATGQGGGIFSDSAR